MVGLYRNNSEGKDRRFLAIQAPFMRVIGSFLLLFAPLTMLLLWFQPALNTRILNNALGHVVFVGTGALTGIGLAWLVLVVALRMQDRRALLIGLALLSSALMFIIHGLATPGVLFVTTGDVPSTSAKLSLMVGSFFFVASGLGVSAADRFVMSRPRLLILAVLICWMIGAWYLLAPFIDINNMPLLTQSMPSNASHVHEPTPITLAPPALAALIRVPRAVLDALFFISLACYLFAIWQYFGIAHRNPSKVSLALVYGIMLLCMALLIQSMSQAYTPLFWVYHIQELAASVLLSIALLTAYRQSLDSSSILESLLLPHTRTRIEANYAHALDQLIATLSRGEQPTNLLRHTLHQRFSLSEAQIQALEQAALAVALERQQRLELEKLTNALQQLQDDKETLVQLVVHDLKNPLTAVIGFLDLLRYTKLTGMQNELTTSALRSAKNLQYLISDLLDIARLEEGKLQLHYSVVNIRALLTEISTEMDAWLRQQQQTLHIDIAHVLFLEGDEQLIRRVLRNLISNAIKHTAANTIITVKAYVLESEPDYCQIEVQDNGPGIPAHIRDTLFERCGRVNSDSPQVHKITVLGLFFSQLAIEAHGGDIGVQREEGQGSTFWMKLPHAHKK